MIHSEMVDREAGFIAVLMTLGSGDCLGVTRWPRTEHMDYYKVAA